MWLVRAILFLLLASVLAGQPELRLKSGAKLPAGTRATVELRRRNLRHAHWIVQFPTAPSRAQLENLRSRGARILGYVPDFAFSVAAPDDMDFEGLGLHSLANLRAKDKTSPLLNLMQDAHAAQFVVVEFHPDVDMNHARTIVLDLDLQIQENPDLLDHHLIALGTSDQIAGLTEWDEVAYVFPASDELTQGLPQHACPGALTDLGTIGQSILRVGDGWGGPGRNGADLNYAFISRTAKLPPDEVAAEIVRAFSEWAKYAKLTFTRVDDAQARRTLAVLFGSGDHGDSYPFDGPGGILAHTFYPFPQNTEPIAGDLHFDADENWNIGADLDLFTVALHETGHALGLGHSDKPGSVMYPYYRKNSALTAEDIAAVLSMYAAQDATPAPLAPLTLTIEQPGVSSAASATLHGRASGGSGDIHISWTSDRGFSGAAKGANPWTAGPVPLSIGQNTVTMTAVDALHTQTVQPIVLTRQADVVTPASGPQLDITAPVTGPIFATNIDTISVSGTAASTSAIARVLWSNSRGGNGQAIGTNIWSTGPIALQNGISSITITAFARDGATVVRTLQVTYSAVTVNDAAPPSLTIVFPALTTVSTPATSISVSGTARDNAGITAITWTSSTGHSGTASGTNSWTIPAIPLLVGTNTITVRATNLAGIAAWRSIVVTRI